MTTCYLCGLLIEADSSRDHVPPEQFFPRSIRREHNLDRLRTLPTHSTCNAAYRHDEEYFLWSVGPLAGESFSGSRVMQDLSERFRAGKFVGLGNAILNEFDERPSGLYLPDGKIVKRLDGERVKRVVWKIVRGLFFYDLQRALPELTPWQIELFEPEAEPRSDFMPLYEKVKAQPSRGAYPGIFDYKYLAIEISGTSHVWGLLFWGQIMAFVFHHDPNCSCEKCMTRDHPALSNRGHG